MSKPLSERRLIENEVIFRQVNESIKEFMKEEQSKATPLRFYCECSNPSCTKRIKISSQTYEALHANKKQFIAVAGHEITDIEHVVNEETGFNVIEKNGTPPAPEEIHIALKKLTALPKARL